MALRAVLARLVWCAQYPERGLAQIPSGWVHGSFGDRTIIRFETSQARLMDAVTNLLRDQPPDLSVFQAAQPAHAFEVAARQADLEALAEFLDMEAPQL